MYCNNLCGAYNVLYALYTISGIPAKYQYNIELKPDAGDMAAFISLEKFKENILEHTANGDNLYIWGKSTGCGKTSWACKIMGYYFRKIVFHTDLEQEGLYIYLPKFLEDLRNAYDRDRADADFYTLLYSLDKCKLLIIDDIGSERVSEWVRERLVSIINERVSNGLSTIYTSNLSPEEFKEKLGDRIGSRVINSSLVVEIKGMDRRDVQ